MSPPAALSFVLGVALILSHLDTPWRVLVPALVPALLQGGLLVWLERRTREPGMLAASFLCGAVAAALVAAPLNQALGALLSAEVGGERSRLLTPLVGAPLIEELAKGAVLAALLFARRPGFDPMLDAIVYGGLVGVGFAMTENANYLLLTAVLGGAEHLPLMIYQRLLGSLNHPVFTATFAAGIGLARSSRSPRTRVLAPIAGGAGAIAQHVFWNGVTSKLTKGALCGMGAGTGACVGPDALSILVTVPLIIAGSLAPGVIAVTAFVSLARRNMASSGTDYGRTS